MNLRKETFIEDYKRKMISLYRESVEQAGTTLKYLALGSLMMDYMASAWHDPEVKYEKEKRKQVYYFSMEFLIGRLMDAALINLGIKSVVEDGLKELGISLSALEEIEPDAGLGNGGLGRLAACFIDSMASLGIAGTGIGIRYRYGLFEQQIQNGYQIETPDNWLKIANVWETRRDDEACMVKFGGNVELNWREDGRLFVNHKDYEPILAVPYDMPVPGFRNGTVNTLRLWSAETEGPGFNFAMFSKGDYEKATESLTAVNAITNVLYPDDSTERGKLLRLKQEYFFTSAGVQSIIRRMKQADVPLSNLHEYAAIHINDTHPALVIPELMRILIDEEGMEWDAAWNITVRTIAYTNHTILAEALEKWNVEMFRKLLPRIYMIVEEINKRFTREVSKQYNGDWNKLNSMSIIQDGVVKMAYLSIVGSHSVNGVAELHTEILKNQELKEFHEFYPGKFNNKTNGITHRRWLIEANPELSELMTETIGSGWQREAREIEKLRPYADDPAFLERVSAVKRKKKEQLSAFIKEKYDINIDPASIFDIQVKRLHMYKRQLLNIMHIMELYNRLCDDPSLNMTPRTFIFAAKAFPGYLLAKNTIKLICTVADKINRDPAVNQKMKVVFMPNYGVSLAQIMIPAGEVSEQISTASKEASGTGNMKFMMNGAVTIATLDGANVEIRREVGDENIVLFGLRSEEVIAYQKNKNYNAFDVIHSDPRLQRIIRQMQEGYFGLAPQHEFDMIVKHLTEENDPYFTLKDFDAYVRAQDKINELYSNRAVWNKMAAVNIASSGVFSSDNTIRRYAAEIWNI